MEVHTCAACQSVSEHFQEHEPASVEHTGHRHRPKFLFLEALLPGEQFNALHCPPYVATSWRLYATRAEHSLPQPDSRWALW